MPNENPKTYLLFDHKEFLGGRKWQLLYRVLLHYHVCTTLISNLTIAATLDTEETGDANQINMYGYSIVNV